MPEYHATLLATADSLNNDGVPNKTLDRSGDSPLRNLTPPRGSNVFAPPVQLNR
jgi:hypothetical protein